MRLLLCLSAVLAVASGCSRQEQLVGSTGRSNADQAFSVQASEVISR